MFVGGRYFYCRNKHQFLQGRSYNHFIASRTMLCQNGNDSVNSQTLSFAQSFFFPAKPQLSPSQAHLETPNRVVKIESPTTTCLQTPSKAVEAVRPKRLKKTWAKVEELEYFCAVIIFSVRNPCLRLSWEEWKPRRFYNFLQSHMEAVFGVGCCRTSRQCKTKDQNLKIQHHKRANKCTDLLDLALSRVLTHVNQAKRAQKQGPRLSVPELHRLFRFDEALCKYKEFVRSMSKATPYEQELQNLMAYEQSVRPRVVEIWQKSIEA